MGVTKKYIGESQLKGEPKKTLGFKIKDGTITADKLSNGAVTTDKLADNSITDKKLSDSSVTTGKLADGSITSPKLSDDLQTLLKKIEDLYPVVKVDELDTLGGLLTTHKEAVAFSIQTEKSRFVVKDTWGNQKTEYVAGILDVLSDAAGHVLTEVLTTHNNMTDGALDKGGHADGKLFQYFRSYNINSPYLPNDVDTWTEWQRLDTYTLSTVSEMISSAIPQMIDGVVDTIDDLPSTKNLYYYVMSEGCFYRTNGKSNKGVVVNGMKPDATLLYITKSNNKIYRWTEADGMIMLSDFSALSTSVSALESSVNTLESDVNTLEKSVETAKGDLATVKSSVEAIEKSINQPNGLATLDENQQLTEYQLPREKTDEVLEFDGFFDFFKVSNMGINGKVYFSKTLNVFASTNAESPTAASTFCNIWDESKWFGTMNLNKGVTPYEGKIYIDKSTNIPYRWNGTTLVAMTSMSSGGTDMTASYDDGYLTLEWSNS